MRALLRDEEGKKSQVLLVHSCAFVKISEKDLVHLVNPLGITFSEVTEYVRNKNKFLCTFHHSITQYPNHCHQLDYHLYCTHHRLHHHIPDCDDILSGLTSNSIIEHGKAFHIRPGQHRVAVFLPNG